MTGTQLALGIAVAAILTGVTIQVVRAAKNSGEYVAHAFRTVDNRWFWKIEKKGSHGDVVADSRELDPKRLFSSRQDALADGLRYASETFGAKEQS